MKTKPASKKKDIIAHTHTNNAAAFNPLPKASTKTLINLNAHRERNLDKAVHLKILMKGKKRWKKMNTACHLEYCTKRAEELLKYIPQVLK